MKYTELPKKHQRTAIQWELDKWNDFYREQGINADVTETSQEVIQALEEQEYNIEYGYYEKGVPYENLVIL